METNENDEVSAISEVDVSEDLPNDDDSAFVSENHEDPQEHVVSTSDNQRVGGCDVETIHANHHGLAPMPDQVYVATSQGLVTAEQLHQAGIKTTHIVIHDETLSVEDDPCLKTPTTPLPPPTPSTPLSREKGFKYQWDDSAFLPILPVRCKSSNGELHKARFGSGGRGRCIKMGDNWYTPSEFEAVCGRASSKDWKRSIRYGGRTLQCLIEDAILNPHATSCTCAACCDDEAVTGPIRLFTPYKRRKRDSTGDILMQKVTSKANTPLSSPMKDAVVVSLAPSSMIHPLRVNNPEAGEMIQIIAADASGNITVGEPTVVMTPLPQTPKIENSIVNMLPLDVSEQKMWWQLEEMSNNLLQQAQQLKTLLDQAKQQCIATKEHALMQLRQQLEKEKNDAINAVRIEAQMNLSRAVIEERAQKDIAVQHALAQARAEMQSDKLDTIGVSAADKVTYSVTWVPQPGSVQNIENMMDGEGDDSDKDKLS